MLTFCSWYFFISIAYHLDCQLMITIYTKIWFTYIVIVCPTPVAYNRLYIDYKVDWINNKTDKKLNLLNFRLKLRSDKDSLIRPGHHLRLSTKFSVLSYILLTYNTVIYLQITCVLITYYHNVRNKRQQSTRLEMQKWLWLLWQCSVGWLLFQMSSGKDATEETSINWFTDRKVIAFYRYHLSFWGACKVIYKYPLI